MNVVWRTALPGGGYGSPVVSGDRIYVVSEPAELLCLRVSDGAVLWQQSHTASDLLGEEKAQETENEYTSLQDRRKDLERQLRDARRADSVPVAESERLAAEIETLKRRLDALMDTYPPPIKRGGAGNAASTPVSDGRNVYAAFGTGIVAAYSSDGQRKWTRFVEASRLGFGHASSPVLADGRVIVHFHDLVALDASNGDELWRVELPARHATPIVTEIAGVPIVITPSGAIVRAADGGVLADGLFSASESSPILDGRMLYVYESSGPKALKLPEAIGETIEVEEVWEGSASRGRRTPSSVLLGGLLYAVNTSGILDITDAETGGSVERRRLDLRKVYSSATAAGDLVFLSGTDGTTLILEAEKPHRDIARNQVEGFGSSPVFVGNRMYIRTRQHLYCIHGAAEPPPPQAALEPTD
jgi:hypothetical protein